MWDRRDTPVVADGRLPIACCCSVAPSHPRFGKRYSNADSIPTCYRAYTHWRGRLHLTTCPGGGWLLRPEQPHAPASYYDSEAMVMTHEEASDVSNATVFVMSTRSTILQSVLHVLSACPGLDCGPGHALSSYVDEHEEGEFFLRGLNHATRASRPRDYVRGNCYMFNARFPA